MKPIVIDVKIDDVKEKELSGLTWLGGKLFGCTGENVKLRRGGMLFYGSV